MDIPALNGTFTGIASCVPVLSVSVVNVISCLEKAARLSDTNKGKQQVPWGPHGHLGLFCRSGYVLQPKQRHLAF